MLKLTHSFCRYSRLTCENISYHTLVEHLTHLSCSQKTCVTQNHQQSLLALSPTSLQLRLLANIRKRFRLKKSHANSSASNTHKQMSESEHPTLTHYSHGGHFEISSEDDISDDQRFESDDNENNGTTVDVPTNERIWEPVGKKTEPNSEGFRFRVVSYNVLAQYLLECHPYLYTECTALNLKWKVRAAKLYEEILSLSPDILCLQEVQVSHMNSFYRKFEQLGYFGIFKQKTGHRHDGCAIYFKQSLFDMQDHINVEFYQPEMPILNRDNIGLMVKLTPKSQPGTSLVVATTHLLYNPKRTDVRLAQMQVMLAEIDRFAYIDKGSGHLPIILTGDFNSTPNSPVINLLDMGYVNAGPYRDNSDWRRIGVTDNCQHLSVYLNRQNGIATDFSMLKIFNSDYTVRLPEHDPKSTEHNALFNSDDIRHVLKLTSVYDKDEENAEPQATTFQDYWVTVDYIYFSCHKSLKLLERLKLPTESECDDMGMMPNDRHGSDHLSLAAIFELQPLKSVQGDS